MSCLVKLGIKAAEAVAIGDTPYDAVAARKAGIPTIGVLCGGFTKSPLREAGCVESVPRTERSLRTLPQHGARKVGRRTALGGYS